MWELEAVSQELLLRSGVDVVCISDGTVVTVIEKVALDNHCISVYKMCVIFQACNNMHGCTESTIWWRHYSADRFSLGHSKDFHCRKILSFSADCQSVKRCKYVNTMASFFIWMQKHPCTLSRICELETLTVWLRILRILQSTMVWSFNDWWPGVLRCCSVRLEQLAIQRHRHSAPSDAGWRHISSLFPLPNWPVLNLHWTVFFL